MKQSETSSKKALVGERPLFSSTWLALFSVLRKNYNDRNHVVTPGSENAGTLAKEKSDIKLNVL